MSKNTPENVSADNDEGTENKDQAELVQMAVAEVRRQFERAQADSAAFSINAALEPYQEALGQDDVQVVKTKLAEQEITDLQEDGSNEVGEVQGRPPAEIKARQPEFERFEISGGHLYDVYKTESGKEMFRSSRAIQLPGWFSEIQSDSGKVEQFLREIADIYKNTHPKDIKVLPKFAHGRIVGFVVKFFRLDEERDIPLDQSIVDAANQAEDERKQYWEGQGVSHFKDEQKRVMIKQMVAQKIAELGQRLGVTIDEPLRVKDGDKGAPPEPATLTPEQVGMTPELAAKVREQVEQKIVPAFADALIKKYPRMDEKTAHDAAAAIISDEEKEAAFQGALRKYRDKKK